MGLTSNLGKLSNMITSTGSAVGIGTSSPSANLQLSGFTSGLPASSGSAQRGGFRIANSSNIAFDFGTVAAGQAWMQVSDVNNYASNFALLLNPNGGNVGIGTSSPLNVLDVRQASAIMGNYQTIQAFSTDSAAINLGGGISLGGFYTGTSSIAQFGSIVGRKENGTSGNYDGYLAFGTNAQATGVVERVRITSSGAVLTPFRPAFRAYYSVNGFWNLNTSDVFIFDLTEYNIGSCYNTSNGRFTAPVAGVYQFNFYTIVWGAVTNGAISFRKNGGFPASGYNVHFSPTLSGAWSNVVYTTSIYLNANDYVNVLNIGPYTQFHGKDWSSFSGYLVG